MGVSTGLSEIGPAAMGDTVEHAILGSKDPLPTPEHAKLHHG
jgi:hypothetical protein